MADMICVDETYSTTRLLTHEKPTIKKKPEDKFESLLFLPEGEGRKGEGGLRTQGYFKTSQTDKPLITVITVVFNGEQFLEETIQSVINQTYDNVEYIIIDGGSTDGTLDIIRKYEHAIDYWVSEKDKGIYGAMNKGCDLALGAGLIFLNAGDRFIGDVLTNELAIPSILPCKIKHENGKITEHQLKDFRMGMPVSHQAMVFQNSDIRYDLKISISADYKYFIEHGRCVNLSRGIFGYVLYDNSGLSALNYWQRDFETYHIIKDSFGRYYGLKFYALSLVKSLIKVCFKKWL